VFCLLELALFYVLVVVVLLFFTKELDYRAKRGFLVGCDQCMVHLSIYDEPSRRRHRRLAGTLLFVCIPTLSTTHNTPRHQRVRTNMVNGSRRDTPSAAAHNSHPTCWLIVVCGGAGSEAPWRPWDDGSRQGRWVHGLASFS